MFKTTFSRGSDDFSAGSQAASRGRSHHGCARESAQYLRRRTVALGSHRRGSRSRRRGPARASAWRYRTDRLAFAWASCGCAPDTHWAENGAHRPGALRRGPDHLVVEHVPRPAWPRVGGCLHLFVAERAPREQQHLFEVFGDRRQAVVAGVDGAFGLRTGCAELRRRTPGPPRDRRPDLPPRRRGMRAGRAVRGSAGPPAVRRPGG